MGLPEDSTRQGSLLFWLALVGAVCLFPFFFVGGPAWSDGPLIRAAWNLGHPLFFAFLTLATRPWRFASGWKLWAIGSLAVLFLGGSVELAQSLDNREADAHDMFRNLTGFWAVMALQKSVGFGHPNPLREWLIRVVAAGLLAIDLVVVSGIALQQVQVSRWLPNVYDFPQDQPGRFWRGNVSIDPQGACGPEPENVLSIALTTRRYSGASLDNLPGNWGNYDHLLATFWNPQDYTIPLTLRINDLAHEQHSNHYDDRFNRVYQIEPGINRIRLSLEDVAEAPADRRMDMNDIRRLMFFTSDLRQPGHLCLSELRLSRDDDAPEPLE